MDKKKPGISRPGPDRIEKPIPERIYPVIDTDLGRDNLENDLPAADLEDLWGYRPCRGGIFFAELSGLRPWAQRAPEEKSSRASSAARYRSSSRLPSPPWISTRSRSALRRSRSWSSMVFT